jgi:hypothetical protein
MVSPISAIISCYQPRGLRNAVRLAHQVQESVAEVIIVINVDQAPEVKHQRLDSFQVVTRPNVGMNIGAWSCGLAFTSLGNSVLFIQDECEVVDPNFTRRYQQLFANPTNGLVGESLNPKWELTWQDLKRSPLNYEIVDPICGVTDRVSYYLDRLKHWGIEAGVTGTHLRALVWGLNSNIREHVTSFPIGHTKEECIAAEIAVSKLVTHNLGKEVVQSGPQHFCCFTHPEWEKSGVHKKLNEI